MPKGKRKRHARRGRPIVCTLNGKAAHSSLQHTKTMARTFMRHLNAQGVLADTLYGYRCRWCGFYHMTRMPVYKGRQNHLLAVAADVSAQLWAMPEPLRVLAIARARGEENMPPGLVDEDPLNTLHRHRYENRPPRKNK